MENKQETLLKQVEGFIMSGKDPFVIARELTDFILYRENTKENKKGRWIADTEKWINEWVDLFPAGVVSGSKLLRSDRKRCLTKMAKFRQDHPSFTVEDIFEATIRYLKEQEEKEYAYTTCAVNFIDHKEKGSELASRCENLAFVEEGADKESEMVDKFFA